MNSNRHPDDCECWYCEHGVLIPADHLKRQVPSHYVYTRYRCRCSECRAKHAEYMKDYRSRKNQREFWRLGR